MIGLDALNGYLQLAAHAITIGGVPVAIGLFLREKRRERLRRQAQAFDQLDDKYVEFMQLCLEHPDVDVFGSPFRVDYTPSPSQLRIESSLFAILISLFERVHVEFENMHPLQKQGWVRFMKSYAYRANFQREWNAIGPQFDERFQRFLNSLVGAEK